MKVQDLIFFLLLTGLWIIPLKNKYIYAGLICLILAIPLFGYWIFFTAERLTWYAAVFFTIHVLLLINQFYKTEQL